MQTRDAFYSVSILTPERGWVVSRFFSKKAAAQRWARWCSGRWAAVVHRGGPGGERLNEYPKAGA